MFSNTFQIRRQFTTASKLRTRTHTWTNRWKMDRHTGSSNLEVSECEEPLINSSLPAMDPRRNDFFIGVGLTMISAIFIGTSFIFKKLGLRKLAKQSSVRAGQGGFGYLKEWLWWAGMLLMTTGEIVNFVAFAFAPATIVTPLGALSVLVRSPVWIAVLSSYVLKERLNILGKISCVLCLLGSTVMVIHSPKEQEVDSMDALMSKLQEPVFVLFTLVVVTITTAMIFYYSPRYGSSNVFVNITICSVLGSFTVMGAKGLGVALKQTAAGDNQFTNWLTWFLIAVVSVCVLIQLNYLNKTLDVFNTSVVTPIYFVFFTSSVMVASLLLFKEWEHMTAKDIVGDLCGFLTIIFAIFLLNGFNHLNVSLANLPSTRKAASTAMTIKVNGDTIHTAKSPQVTRDTTASVSHVAIHIPSVS